MITLIFLTGFGGVSLVPSTSWLVGGGGGGAGRSKLSLVSGGKLSSSEGGGGGEGGGKLFSSTTGERDVRSSGCHHIPDIHLHLVI